jgi:hypothetical protein
MSKSGQLTRLEDERSFVELWSSILNFSVIFFLTDLCASCSVANIIFIEERLIVERTEGVWNSARRQARTTVPRWFGGNLSRRAVTNAQSCLSSAVSQPAAMCLHPAGQGCYQNLQGACENRNPCQNPPKHLQNQQNRDLLLNFMVLVLKLSMRRIRLSLQEAF